MSATRRRTPSSTVALGAATLFLAVAAMVSFLADDGASVGRGWSLRGTLLPGAEAKPRKGV